MALPVLGPLRTLRVGEVTVNSTPCALAGAGTLMAAKVIAMAAMPLMKDALLIRGYLCVFSYVNDV
jgi:hypothetical protein